MTSQPAHRILLLDDDQATLDLYADVLGPDSESDSGPNDPDRVPGLEMTTATTADQAVRAVEQALSQQRPYALAVLDVRLDNGPGGVEAAERIRALDPDVELVLLTGHQDVSLEELNRRLPPAQKLLYLEKPVSPRELRQAVLSLCAKWRAATELKRLNADLSREVQERLGAQRSLEDQFLQVQKMEALGTLAGGIAHDFNNILGVIMGYAEIMADDAAGDDRLARRVEQILAAGRRGRDLVDQILDFSRQTPQARRSLSLAEEVDKAMTLVRASAPSGVEVEVRRTAGEDRVRVEGSRFQQIVLNLCSNALHALGGEGGRIVVEIADVDENDPHAAGLDDPDWYLRLSVTDNGSGIPREALDRLFEPFFTTKPPGQGTGIGLSVVHGIVKQHEGHVAVDSEPGRGAAFHVYLPRADRPEGVQPGPEAVLVPVHGRVLFVDDEKPLVDLGVEMLSELGFTVTGRTSSVEALEAFRHRPEAYDLVITDYAMPNMSGLQLARELLVIRPGLPILLCTGFSESVSLERARSLGISDLIMKPILKNKLIQSIADLLDEESGGALPGA